MALSLFLPLLKINFWLPVTESNQAIRVLQAVSVGDEYMSNIVITAHKNNWSFEQLYTLIYWLVSITFFLIMLRTLFLIRTLLKKYPVQQVEDVAFVNTEDDSTPFSFLQYIFWNSSIDIDTITGRQIFKHELAHIQEKHTHDKLFVNIILIFCWCNPFFWLYRKELNMIHEFIADKKAVEDSDTAAFAAMILQAAYPKHRFELTNNFFYSPIKRRLLMLSKNKNPRVNYFGRIMVLPLIVLVFAAFSLKAKNDRKTGTQFNIISNATDKSATLPLIDSLFKSVAVKNTTDTVPKKIPENATKEKKPLYILNGQEIDEKALSAISTNNIESVNILKDKNAVERYGEKAKNGVVEVVLKKQLVVVSESKNPELMNDSIFYIYGFSFKGRLAWKINNIDIPNKALYILNGKEVPEEIAAKITDKNVTNLTVLKVEEATKDYGSKGVNGVVIINTNPGYEIRTWKADTIKFYKTERFSGVNKKMLVIVDGKFYYDKTLQQVADESGITQFETILFLPSEKAVARYGDKAKDGAVLVTLKKAKEAAINKNTNDLKTPNDEAKIYIGNSTGGRIDLDYLKNQKEILVSNGYSFVSATLYFSGNYSDNIIGVSLNSTSLSKIEKYINQCKNGTALTFDNVYLKDNNGKILKMTSPPGFAVVTKSDDKVFIKVEQEKSESTPEIYKVPLKVHMMNENEVKTYQMIGNGEFAVSPGILYYLNGKVTNDPKSILKIDVLYMESYDPGSGKKYFGEKGKNGVLLLKTKS